MIDEHNSFLEYYEQYKDKIYSYYWYRTGFNQSLAEDLTSEIFIKALKNYDSFDESRSFQAWIYKIAKNHLINFYTKLGREVPLESVGDIPYNEKDNYDNKLELEETIEKIKKMKPYHREVLILRFVDGLTNSEIAHVLDKDEGAIRTQISRALKEIKKET